VNSLSGPEAAKESAFPGNDHTTAVRRLSPLSPIRGDLMVSRASHDLAEMIHDEGLQQDRAGRVPELLIVHEPGCERSTHSGSPGASSRVLCCVLCERLFAPFSIHTLKPSRRKHKGNAQVTRPSSTPSLDRFHSEFETDSPKGEALRSPSLTAFGDDVGSSPEALDADPSSGVIG
jgi:hypothetical protein